ncbi:MAG: hypothetical protein CL674_09065 [Bdellovibrionaceae bacterium]|nr:hypothetical protein [Pseudobdellovibrionaceae bacterium]
MTSMTLCRRFISVNLILSILFFNLQTSYAQSSSCRRSLSEDIKVTQSIELKNSNVFSESLNSTIINSVLWLSAVQMIKYMSLPEGSREFFTDAMLVTVPLDVGLTLMSHYISLGKLQWLKAFSEGKLLGPKYEFWSRVAANTLISTGGILSSWSLANLAGINIPIESDTVLAALSLSAIVYTSMQIVKPALFKQLPAISDWNSEKRLKKILGPRLTSLKQEILQNQDQVPEDTILARDIFLKSLEIIIVQKKWYDKIDYLNNIGVLSARQKQAFTPLLKKYRKASSSQDKFEIERSILSKIIFFENANRSVPGVSLELSGMNLPQSKALISAILKNSRDRKISVHAASLIDQSLWVGFAGGVLLYSTTHWAIHDEIPLFLQNLFL